MRKLACLLIVLAAACGTDSIPEDSPTGPRPAVVLPADTEPQAAISAGLSRYFDGLEMLRTGAIAQAVSALNQAGTLLPAHEGVHLALAVAQLLAGESEAAKRVFDRQASRSRHAALWQHVHAVVSGDLNAIPSIPRSMQNSYRQVECNAPGAWVPGHVQQGDDSFPTAYASFLVQEFAAASARARCGQPAGDTDLDGLRQQAGAWFARVSLAHPELAGFHLGLGFAAVQEGNFERAMMHAEFVGLRQPEAVEYAWLRGRLHLAAGQLERARRFLSQTVTAHPGHAGGYGARAAAAGMMGDADAAGLDLRIADELDSDVAELWADVADDLPAQSPADDVAQAATSLARLSAYARPMAELTDAARVLHRAASPRRLRYAEIYTRKLHTLLRAAEREDDAASWTAAALFVAEEATLRGERVEPRSPRMDYRFQHSREAELERALSMTTRALERDGRHVPSLMARAEILMHLTRDDEAEQMAERALAIDPDDREALTLYAMYKGRRANALSARAAALRQESCSRSSRRENRSDGVWEVTTTTCYPPTPAELAEAEQLDRIAAQLRAESQGTMRKVLDMTRGTYEGELVQAEVFLWQARTEQAVDALRRAVRLAPNDPRAHESLVRLLPRIGAHEEVAEHSVIVNSAWQTTAAPMLLLARREIGAGRTAAARRFLARAAQLDPQDARVPAYLGVVETMDGQADAALAAFRRGFAMESARLQLDRVEALPLDIEEYALTIALVQQLAELYLRSDRADDALQIHAQVSGLATRFAGGWRAVPLYRAHLPPFDGEPMNGATAVAASWLAVGRIAEAAGDRGQARNAYEAALALGAPAGRANIGTATGDSNFDADAGEPAGDALVALMRMGLEDGDFAGVEALNARLGYLKMSQASRQQANALNGQIGKAQSLAQRDQERRDLQRDPRYMEQQRAVQERLRQDRNADRDSCTGNTYQGRCGMAAGLRIDERLTGRWRYDVREQWQYLGGSGVFDFRSDGSFAFSASSGERRVGQWGLLGPGVTAVLLLGEDGIQETIYLEARGSDHYEVTTEMAVGYDLRRQR